MFQLRSVNKALKNIDPFLELERGDGYFYFIYDNGSDIYETKSENVYRLTDVDLDTWVEWGRDFLNGQVEDVKQRHSLTAPDYCNPLFRLKGSDDV